MHSYGRLEAGTVRMMEAGGFLVMEAMVWVSSMEDIPVTFVVDITRV